ncbi:MAG: NUDIX domain-containing protein [Actinomycetes bacterium]
MELPLDLPVIERDLPVLERAIRLVVQDVRGEVLLFWTHEGSMRELGHWWELPGGGIDEGETYVEAAVRELREEAGLEILPEQVGAPTWRRTASFRHRQTRRLQHEVVAVVGSVSSALTSMEPSASTMRKMTTPTSSGYQCRTSSQAPSGSIPADSPSSYPTL